jgi:hypothetical protein
MHLQYNSDNPVQIGRAQGKLAIGQPPNNFQFSCNGAGQFSSFCEATKFQTTSDQRIKSNIQLASLDECTRLVKAVHPKLYTRNDMNGEKRLGYVAQDWREQLQDGYRCIMGVSEDAEGPLLALEYGRVCVILHGCLLDVMQRLDSALARIDALESRL